MKPKPGGGGIEWPVSGWPKHGPLIVAFLVVLSALLLALLFFGDRSSEDALQGDPEVTVQPADTE